MSDESPHTIATHATSLLHELSYTVDLKQLKTQNQRKGRYITVVSSFFVPFAFYMDFNGQAKTRDRERFLSTINNKYLAFLMVLAHNTIVQWSSGVLNGRGGLGTAENQKCMYMSISLSPKAQL